MAFSLLALLGACAHRPVARPGEEEPPACRTPAHEQLAAALTEQCATSGFPCDGLDQAFARCRTGWVDAAALGGAWSEGKVALWRTGGTWKGAVFEARDGTWHLVGLEGP